MNAPKKKTNSTAKAKTSDIVKANIARQRTRFCKDEFPGAGVAERSRRAEVFATYERFGKSEFPISSPELARLAISIKGTKDFASISDSDLDDILQFIARCQWRIEATKSFWGGYSAAFYEEDLDEAEPTEVVKKIREAVKRLREEANGITLDANGLVESKLPKPIPFDQGLILIGVPERPKEEGESASQTRTRIFEPIFSEWYIGASQVSHMYGGAEEAGITVKSARPLSSWVEPTEKEIRAAYKKRIKEGWGSGTQLEILSQYVEHWRKKKQTEANRENANRRTKKKEA